MAALPEGTVTFVFTDVEGSTKLLHELGADAYASALSKHRRVVRDAFAAGVEVDTQGDAFFFAFARASDALEACRAAVAALEGGPVRIRVGLHTGEPLVTEEGYVGVDVHRAARIAAVGHGGQIVLSQSTRDLVPETELLDLGEHRLKDLARPERLYQLGTQTFAPLRSLNLANLPLQPTPLVGRRRELEAIVSLMDAGSRIVTLTGPGGSGKTRLALQAAAELADRFENGVWFVSLAAADSPALLPFSVASVLGVEGSASEWLRNRTALLVIDNLEHLLPEAAAEVGALLSGEGVRIIATSRERLALAAEHEFPVDPLPVEDGVELFLTRASQIGVHPQGTAEVARVVELVDALPLAVELAAARTKVMTVADIAQRLEAPLDVLRGGPRDAPARQQTLRATIEWSVSLLSSDEREAFVRMGVFRGSFDLASAEHVANADVDVVAALIDKNLIRRTDDGRLFLLETLRQFAREQFESHELRPMLEERHALLLVERAPRAPSEDRVAWRRRIERSYGDVRAALEWLRANGRDAEFVELAVALRFFWDYARFAEGRVWLEAAAAVGGSSASQVCAITGTLAHIAFRQGDWDASIRRLEETLVAANAAGDLSAAAMAHALRGAIAYFHDDVAGAVTYYEEGLAMARTSGDDPLVANLANDVAQLALADRRLEDAARLARESLDLARALSIPTLEAAALSTLSQLRDAEGDPRAATRLAADALRIVLPTDPPRHFLSEFVLRLAALALQGDEVELAARLLAAYDAEEPFDELAIEPNVVELRERTSAEIERRRRAGLVAVEPVSLEAAAEMALSWADGVRQTDGGPELAR